MPPLGLSLALMAASQPKVPRLPTLEDLQKHAQDLADQFPVPAYSSSPKTAPKIAIKPNYVPSISGTNTGGGDGAVGSGAHRGSGGTGRGSWEPPVYSVEDPARRGSANATMEVHKIPRKLQKQVIGYRRMQGGLPDVTERLYATSTRRNSKQPSVEEMVDPVHTQEWSFWKWITCRDT